MKREDYRLRDRPAVAPIVFVVAGLVLAAVAVSMWVYSLLGVHFG